MKGLEEGDAHEDILDAIIAIRAKAMLLTSPIFTGRGNPPGAPITSLALQNQTGTPPLQEPVGPLNQLNPVTIRFGPLVPPDSDTRVIRQNAGDIGRPRAYEAIALNNI